MDTLYISKNFRAVIETDEFKSPDQKGLQYCIEKLNRNQATEYQFLMRW